MTKQQPTQQYLPTPPLDFWEAVLTVRNYLMVNIGPEIYALTPPLSQEADLKDAINIIDNFIDMLADELFAPMKFD